MNKFFTSSGLLLFVFFLGALASDENMISPAPAPQPPAPESEGEAAILPALISMSRYEALSKKSPFTAVTVEETAGFAQDLVLAGYVRLKGEDFVMVANRTTPDRFLVGKKESPGAHGLLLVEVQKDPKGDPAKMKAKVKKGQEVATLAYAATPASATPPGQPPVPGLPTPGQTPPAGQPGSGAAVPPQLQPGQTRPPSTPVIRRRIIPIPPALKR